MKKILILLLVIVGLSAAAQRGGRSRSPAPKVGAVAPEFTLKDQQGKKEYKLSALRKKKPVVLIFGSIT